MDRRAFILTAAGGLLAAPLAVEAQPGKVWRIGFLGASPSTVGPFIQAFEQGLRELGYVDGQNIAIEYRSAQGKDERLPLLAAELVRLKVDVLVAALPQGAAAAKKATTTIPIVMVNVGDPVEIGLVASLARPGGNVTGLSRLSAELIAKNLALLKEAVPRALRVGALSNPTTPLSPVLVRNAKRAAESLGLQLKIVEAKVPDDLEGAFSALATDRVGALLVLADGMFWGERKRSPISRSGVACRRCSATVSMRTRGGSWPMRRARLTLTVAPPSSWTRFSRAQSPATFPSSNPRSSNS